MNSLLFLPPTLGLSSTAVRCPRKGAFSRLQMSGSSEDEAKKEAQKWADMAARMKVNYLNGILLRCLLTYMYVHV